MTAEKVATATPADLIARRVKELVDAAPPLTPSSATDWPCSCGVQCDEHKRKPPPG